MEHEHPERTHWAILIAGLAATLLIVWFDAVNPVGRSAAIVGLVEPRLAGRSKSHDPAAERTAQGAPAMTNPLAALSKDALATTLQRPLFSPTRRPPVVRRPDPSPPPARPRPDPSDLKLIGIIQSSQGAVALIQFKTVRDTLSVREGEVVEGWAIEKIGRRRIEVHKSGDTATLHLSGDTTGSGQ